MSKTIWKLLHKVYGRFRMPFVMFDHFIGSFLWDMYWHKHVAPEKYNRKYRGRNLIARLREALYIARYGED